MAFSLTLATLRGYVRDYTGIYSADLLPDATISNTINEIYFELAASEEKWSWTTSGTVTQLADGTAPTFDGAYHFLLVYKASAEILEKLGDDTSRVAIYNKEYSDMVSELRLKDLSGKALGNRQALASDILLVRSSLGVYNSKLSDTYISQTLLGTLKEYLRLQDWPYWIDVTNEGTYNTAVISTFNDVIALKAAIKLGQEINIDPNIIQGFQKRYDELYQLDVKRTFNAAADGANGTIAFDIKFVRNLLNVYDESISDTYISSTLYRTLKELKDLQNWPWTIALTNSTTYATGVAGFQATWINAYKAAVTIGNELGVEPAKMQALQAHYDALYASELENSLIKTSTVAFDCITVASQETSLVKAVRTVLNVFDSSISNAFIYNKLKEEYEQFNKNYANNWTWSIYTQVWSNVTTTYYTIGGAVKTLVYSTNEQGKLIDTGPFYDIDGDIVLYDDIYQPSSYQIDFSKLNQSEGHPSFIGSDTSDYIDNDYMLIVYGVAIRLSMALGMPELFSKTLQAEYDSILDKLIGIYFTDANTVNQNLFDGLVQRAQAYSNNYSTNLNINSLMKMLWNENVILLNERDWEFSKAEIAIALSAGTGSFDLGDMIGYGENDAADKIQIINAYTTNADGTNKRIINSAPTLLDIDANASEYYYKMTGATIFNIAPTPAETLNLRIKFRFTNDYASPAEGMGLGLKSLAYAEQFHDIIVYRLAAKLAILNADENAKNLVPLFLQMANDLRDAMVSYYQQEHSDTPIQMGTAGLNTQRYLPLFKVG